MNKLDLAREIAEKAKIQQQQAVAVINALEQIVKDELAKGGEVALVGFGTFSVKERAARTGRNPKTGEVLNIAATKVPQFKAGKLLKDAVK